MKRTFKLTLGESEIADLQRELNDYSNVRLPTKSDLLGNAVGNAIARRAQNDFQNAVVDDLIGTSPRMANVKVTCERKASVNGGFTVVIAHGEDAVWVEFGAGVYHNGAVGSSPNPLGSANGFTIGSYGANGGKTVWGFYENGTLQLTHGTPASMPMYHAIQDVCKQIDKIAGVVFG